jgi:hypothetical protein
MMPPPAAFLCEGSIIVARASVPSLYYSKCINTALHVRMCEREVRVDRIRGSKSSARAAATTKKTNPVRRTFVAVELQFAGSKRGARMQGYRTYTLRARARRDGARGAER